MTRSLLPFARQRASMARTFRALGATAAMAALAACSSQGPTIDQTQEARVYQSRARGNYHSPGSGQDPWGPYVSEASRKFDVPERWVREVMRVESGGQLYQNGQLITSRAGAMGLMQVMPETYDELRLRYALDDDAYDPHNNILAGTAYLREMYDIYGSPGFLAAYNAGPKRLDDYLANVRPLPDETRRYVAMIGPYITDSYPIHRSPAEQYAMNDLPIQIPSGLRYGGRGYAVAEARPIARASAHTHKGQMAVASRSRAPVRMVLAARSAARPTPRGKHAGGFSLIQPALAETLPAERPAHGAKGGWAVQVGAFSNQSQAKAAVGAARQKAALGGARPAVATVKQGHETLYRARLNGLSRESALQACHRLGRSRTSCMVLAPDLQS